MRRALVVLAVLLGAGFHAAAMPQEWEPRVSLAALTLCTLWLAVRLYNVERAAACLVFRIHAARSNCRAANAQAFAASAVKHNSAETKLRLQSVLTLLTEADAHLSPPGAQP